MSATNIIVPCIHIEAIQFLDSINFYLSKELISLYKHINTYTHAGIHIRTMEKKLIEYHLNQCSQNSSVGVNL